MVNIEANAVGTPVVAYKSSGLIDSVKDKASGVLCKENTPEELAGEVVNLLNSEKEYIDLVDGALSWSKNFFWRRSIKRSLNLIINIAKGK